MSGSLRDAAAEIDAMLEETAPKDATPEETPPPVVAGIDLGWELRRRRLRRAGLLEHSA